MRLPTIAAFGATLVCVLVAWPAFARGHKELNATWSLMPTRSNFAGEPAIQSGTVTIFDREGNITVSRNFVYDGPDQSYFYKYTTDGPENATIHATPDLKSKVKWEGHVLVITTTESGATTEEQYSLDGDDTLVARVQRPGHRPIVLFFQRENR